MAKSESVEQLASRGIDRWGFPLPGGARPLPVVPQTAAKALQGPRTQAGRGSFADARLIPGLRALCDEARAAKKVRTYTCDEIAKRCDVNKETVRAIEIQAVKKLRARLGAAHMNSIREILAVR